MNFEKHFGSSELVVLKKVLEEALTELEREDIDGLGGGVLRLFVGHEGSWFRGGELGGELKGGRGE
jgi:hypothetical protein